MQNISGLIQSKHVFIPNITRMSTLSALILRDSAYFLHSIPSDNLWIDNFMILFPCGSNILKMPWANECAKARLTHLHRLEALTGALCFTYFFEKWPDKFFTIIRSKFPYITPRVKMIKNFQ